MWLPQAKDVRMYQRHTVLYCERVQVAGRCAPSLKGLHGVPVVNTFCVKWAVLNGLTQVQLY